MRCLFSDMTIRRFREIFDSRISEFTIDFRGDPNNSRKYATNQPKYYLQIGAKKHNDTHLLTITGAQLGYFVGGGQLYLKYEG